MTHWSGTCETWPLRVRHCHCPPTRVAACPQNPVALPGSLMEPFLSLAIGLWAEPTEVGLVDSPANVLDTKWSWQNILWELLDTVIRLKDRTALCELSTASPECRWSFFFPRLKRQRNVFLLSRYLTFESKLLFVLQTRAVWAQEPSLRSAEVFKGTPVTPLTCFSLLLSLETCFPQSRERRRRCQFPHLGWAVLSWWPLPFWKGESVSFGKTHANEVEGKVASDEKAFS